MRLCALDDPAQEAPLLPVSLPAVLARSALFLGLWLVLAGPSGLPFGLLAVACATWSSLRLLPPRPGRLDPHALAGLVGLTVRQTVLAGWDVARRAFTRPPDVTPGVLDLPLALPPGPPRDAFRALASLAPGSLPLADPPGGALRLHTLDTALPLARDMGAAASAFARLKPAVPHG